MITLQRTKGILALSAAVLIIVIGVFVFAIYYLNQIGSEISDLQAQVTSEKQVAEAANALKKSLSENAGSIDSIDSFFVSADEETDFIKSIESLAKSSNTDLNIETFTHASIEGNQKFEYAVMQATARGSLQNVYHLLVMIESLPKAIEVGQVDLQYIPGDPKKAREWRLAFSLKALKLK